MRFPIKYPLLINILLLCAAVAVAAGVARMARQTMALRAELRETRARAEVASARRGDLLQRLKEQDALEAVEYEAKAKLNLKNPGEEAVVVVAEEKRADARGSSGFLRRIRGFFAKMF